MSRHVEPGVLEQLGGDRIDEVAATARDMVAQGRGDELMVLPGWWHVITALSYLDYCAELPDVLALAPRISCPVLYMRGDKEPRELYPAEAFARRCAGACTVQIVPQCDHFYVGCETVIADIVCRWLDGLKIS